MNELPAIPEAPIVPASERVTKLARSNMRSYAHKMLKEQGGQCPLCFLPIDLTIKGEGVIDHDHDTGRIRGLLHRSCNAAEGKIANAAARWGCKSSDYKAIVAYLERMVQYLQTPARPLIYPMHKTPDEKKDARNKAKREAAAVIRAKRELARQQRQENK